VVEIVVDEADLEAEEVVIVAGVEVFQEVVAEVSFYILWSPADSRFEILNRKASVSC
jgi:hypothetical protein